MRGLRRIAWQVAAAIMAASAVFGLAGSAGASTAVSAGARAATARAVSLVPSSGLVFTGVSAGSAGAFAGEVGKHPAVYGEFVTWGQSIHYAFAHAVAAHARLMLHISTTMGYGAAPVITPAGIAHGDGDGYLLALSALIAAHQRPLYIRLLPEMDQANNAYCAFNTDGSSRGPANAPAAFVAAWRRVVVVLRGGPVGVINARLAALGEPALHGRTGGAVARSRISFVWTPQTAGSPDTPANSPAAYYPGDGYVDWVGTDFYSRFPNFAGLEAFYKHYPQKPFAFGEWALWGADSPTFVNALFAWVNNHPRVQMMLYNQGYGSHSPFALAPDPASTTAIRQQLAPPRYLAKTPDW